MGLIKIDVSGLDALPSEFGGKLIARLDANLQGAVKTSGHKVEADAVVISPYYKGEFLEKLEAMFPEPFKAVVGSHAKHAPFVELDTRPHWPPIAPMVEYAHIKLGKSGKEARRVGYLIARKISISGTKGRHIMARAADANIDNIERIFVKAIEDSIKPQ